MPGREWFIENGCELTKPSMATFIAVFTLSHGEPCNGCNCKDTCSAWPKLQYPASRVGSASLDIRPRCRKCGSLLNMVKVERRGGKCSCGAKV